MRRTNPKTRRTAAALVATLAVAGLWPLSSVGAAMTARTAAGRSSRPAMTAQAGARPAAGPIAATERPCAKSIAKGWTCVTLTVPADHFQDSGRTMDVTFAVLRHTGPGPGKGPWVTITGGPGTAGIYSAVSYTDFFAPSIRRQYDIVFMDQRGSGQSGGFNCPYAVTDFYLTDSGPEDPDGGEAFKQAAHSFVDDCLAESGVDQSLLPYYATKQAAEDLEAFRIWDHAKKLTLYGESYGTQYVQTYAASHPKHVKTLFLDGAVDLTVNGPRFYVEGARAFDDAIAATLLRCTTKAPCSRDVEGGNALLAYDQLHDRLGQAPETFAFTRRDGTVEQRTFTQSDLETAALDAMYGQFDRQLFMRAMVAASHDHLWWLARLELNGLYVDPDTYAPILDPSYSDALYYAVECVDYAYFPNAGDSDARANAYLRYARRHDVPLSRGSADFYGDLPCVYWPAQPGPDPRPSPAPDAPYPLVVLGATLDPATPLPNAERIVARRTSSAGTWLIYQPGGPHVIFGRGNACPDDLVTAILADGIFPREKVTVCPGSVADPYVHVPDMTPTDAKARAVFTNLADEITAGVDYQYWYGVDPLAFGCAFGGTTRYRAVDDGYRVALDDCAYWPGGAVSGHGLIGYDGSFTLRLDRYPHLRYVRDPDGAVTIQKV